MARQPSRTTQPSAPPTTQPKPAPSLTRPFADRSPDLPGGPVAASASQKPHIGAGLPQLSDASAAVAVESSPEQRALEQPAQQRGREAAQQLGQALAPNPFLDRVAQAIRGPAVVQRTPFGVIQREEGDEVTPTAPTITLDDLIARIGTPLTSKKIDFKTTGLDANTRKALLTRLQNLKKNPPSPSPDLEALQGEVAAIELAYTQAETETARLLAEKNQKRLEEEAAAEKLRVELQNEQEAGERNKLRMKGKGPMLAQLRSFAGGTDIEAEQMLKLVPLGQEGQLAHLTQYANAESMLGLLGLASIVRLKDLLPAAGADQGPALIKLLKVAKPGSDKELIQLLEQSADDKLHLVPLLTKLAGDAVVALELMNLGGDESEQKLTDLLTKGVAVADARSLLSTTSGRGSVDDVLALVVYGKMPINRAITLLNTPGAKGSGSDVLDMLAHPEVGDDTTKATELLSKAGSGSDVLSMLQVKRIAVSKAEAELIMATAKFAKGSGEKIGGILQRANPAVSVAQLVTLMADYSADELSKFLDPAKGGQTYAALNPFRTRNIWVDATCGAPSYTPSGTKLSDIQSDAGPVYGGAAPVGGKTYAGNRAFGNALAESTDQLLPTVGTNGTTALSYTEYDIHPYTGPNRGKERVIVCSDGRKFYTSDHYTSFAKFG